jgi:hypothetical protein
MDNYDFLNTFITAIAQNAAIESWAQAQFGASLSVFADVTSSELPGSGEMPYALVHTPAVEKHQDRREQRYGISVDIAVNKDALATRAETNVEQPAGIELILDLATLVVSAVKAAIPANTTMGYSLSADTLGALPDVFGYIDFDFTTLVTIAGDPLA